MGMRFIWRRAVRKAEEIILANKYDKNYLKSDGLPSLFNNSLDLLFGDSYKPKRSSIAGTQSISGTGALSLAAAYLQQFEPYAKDEPITVVIGDPSWSNHRAIFEYFGCRVQHYKYFLDDTKKPSLENALTVIDSVQPRSCLVLQASGHNPTGSDYSLEEFKQIMSACKKKSIIVLFDIAYQGCCQSISRDAQPLRLALEMDLCFIVAQSFSKNMGIYSDRTGMLFIIAPDEISATRIQTHLRHLSRRLYSSPPSHGARIVECLLTTTLKEKWLAELEILRKRLEHCRKILTEELCLYDTKWKFIANQQGFFSYLFLTAPQCARLRDEFHIYVGGGGRVSVAGLSDKNIKYVANSIVEVAKKDKD